MASSDALPPYRQAERRIRGLGADASVQTLLETGLVVDPRSAAPPDAAVAARLPHGCLVLPNALSAAKQRHFARAALHCYAAAPPHVTNLSVLGQQPVRPLPSLWRPSADPCLRKALRWASLGRVYDWTARKYAQGAETPLPRGMAREAVRLVRAAEAVMAAPSERQRQLHTWMQQEEGRDGGESGGDGGERRETSRRRWDAYRPQAALVNFYPLNATLGGHVDDAEEQPAPPIVSISLGAPAVFLVAHPPRADDPRPLAGKMATPAAILLRSGDAVVMTGASRRSVHGVPRILTPDQSPFWPWRDEEGEEEGEDDEEVEEEDEEEGMAGWRSWADDAALDAFLATHRININVRQVDAEDTANAEEDGRRQAATAASADD